MWFTRLWQTSDSFFTPKQNGHSSWFDEDAQAGGANMKLFPIALIRELKRWFQFNWRSNRFFLTLRNSLLKQELRPNAALWDKEPIIFPKALSKKPESWDFVLCIRLKMWVGLGLSRRILHYIVALAMGCTATTAMRRFIIWLHGW